MKVFEDALLREDLSRGGVGTVGNYDGVHRGQRALLEGLTKRARELDCSAVVVTFEPHPMKVLRPNEAPLQLTTPSQKRDLLAECGIDVLCVVRFDAGFAQTSASEFVTGFLHERLGLEEVYVGSRFTFGRGREGNLALLSELGAAVGRPAFGVAELLDDGEPVSSTRIRGAVARGDLETAQRLLGRPYRIQGTVTEGAGKGRQLGFPTLNLDVENELLPGHGVYVTEVRLEGDANPRPSVSNVGLRPTLHRQSAATVECHVFDFDRHVYGDNVEVAFLSRLREERTFEGVEALREQIVRDAVEARKFFERADSMGG